MLKNKYLIGGISILVLILLHSEAFLIPAVHAAPTLTPGIGGNVGQIVQIVLSYLVTFLQTLALIALGLVEYFLRPEFLTNPGMMGPEGSLKQIWIFSRDIVNFIFALMLIGVAFYTIIAGSSDKIKQYIQHFVLAVILVNFSWFFPRVILDVSNILTSTVFSLPQMVLGNTQCQTVDDPPQDCTIITKVTLIPKDQEVDNCDPAGCKCYPGVICFYTEPFTSATGQNVHSIVSALAVNFGRITTMVQVPQQNNGNGAVGNGVQIQYNVIFNILFATVFLIAMTFPLLGLAVGLLIRILILWACIAFMPFTFIGYVLTGSLSGSIPGLDEKYNIWKQFLTAAFLPLLVAIPITVGFIMIIAGTHGMNQADLPMPITSTTPIVQGISNLWQFMWAFFAIGVIWIGAFGALRKSEIIGGVTDQIKGFGETMGKAAIKAPLLVPLPIPGGGGKSIGQMAGGPASVMKNIANAKFDQNLSDVLNPQNARMNAQGRDLTAKLDPKLVTDITNSIRTNNMANVRALLDKPARAAGINPDALSSNELDTLLQRTNDKFKTALEERDRNLTPPPAGPAGTPPPTPPPTINVDTDASGDVVINVNSSDPNKRVKTKSINSGDDAVAEIYNKFNITGDNAASRKVAEKGFDDLAAQTKAKGDLAFSDKATKVARALTDPKNATRPVEDVIKDSFK